MHAIILSVFIIYWGRGRSEWFHQCSRSSGFIYLFFLLRRGEILSWILKRCFNHFSQLTCALNNTAHITGNFSTVFLILSSFLKTGRFLHWHVNVSRRRALNVCVFPEALCRNITWLSRAPVWFRLLLSSYFNSLLPTRHHHQFIMP